jgi:hypothetical protein
MTVSSPGCQYGISLEEELKNRQRIRFSKSIEDAPVGTPILVLLADGSIHISIKRQSIRTYSNQSELYFYFDIMDTETQEPCYVSHEEVAGFAPIPEILT